MRTVSLLPILALVALPGSLPAQHRPAAGQTPPAAPGEARQHDFLIGQWELTVRVPPSGLAQRIHGTPRLSGTWKAWRAFDGFGIEDELRITDAAGNPTSFSHAMRWYDRATRTWQVANLDVYRSRLVTTTAEWRDNVMTMLTRGTDAEGKPVLFRSRFHDITPNSFRWQQDRSSDDGKRWTEGILRIEAKRVAATAPR